MISMVEFYKTVPGDIFEVSDYQINWTRNILFFYHFPSNTIIDTNKCFNFDVKIVLVMRNTNNILLELKLCISMSIREVVKRTFKGYFNE